MPRPPHRPLLLLIASLAVSFALAPAAHAASLVYIQAGNVFIADANGANPHQVTLDGTTATPNQTAYRTPSEADDGTILAAKGGELFHLRQNGDVIAHFLPASRGYPLAAAISPDAKRFTYNYSTITQCTVYEYSCGYYPSPGSDIESIDGQGADDSGKFTQDGVWIDNATVVAQEDSSYVDYQPLGAGAQHWFVPSDAFNPFSTSFPYPTQPAVSRDKKYFEVVMRPNSSGGNPSADDVLEMWSMTGDPPAAPTPLCGFQAVDAGGFQRPTFSPDDSTISWQDAAGVEELTVDYTTCKDKTLFSLTDGPALVAGASEPSFGSAANAPGPRTPSGGGGTPTGSVTPQPSATPIATAAPSGKPKLTLKAASVRRAALFKKGVKVSVSCTPGCTVKAKLTISAKTAKRYGLGRTIASGTGKAGPSATLHLKLTRKARRKLAHAHGLKVRLALTATGTGGTTKKTVAVKVR